MQTQSFFPYNDMHIYIYDSFLSQKKYEPTLINIETRITDLGLNGKIIRLSATNNLYSAIENEVKKGAKTIVAVGADVLVNQVISSLATLKKNRILSLSIPIGIIPVSEKNNIIAQKLGINSYKQACNILSARLVKEFTIGSAGDYYFFLNATIPTSNTILTIDSQYQLEIPEKGSITISNSSKKSLDLTVIYTNISNKVSFFSNNRQKTTLSFKVLNIANTKFTLILDNYIQVKLPVDIFLANETIHIITGKNID